MLGISVPSLPILYAHYRHSSIAPMAGSADCFCSYFFQVKFPVWSNGCKLLVAVILTMRSSHLFHQHLLSGSVTRLGIKMTSSYGVSNI